MSTLVVIEFRVSHERFVILSVLNKNASLDYPKKAPEAGEWWRRLLEYRATLHQSNYAVE